MHDLCDPLRRAAASSSNVLVVGEDGTGKDFAARLLHDLSERSTAPFVAFHPGAFHEDEIERELFGVPGAAGKLEAARGGTLFLDEVTDLPPRCQARLARALDHGRDLDIRVIACSQHDLCARAREGSFRLDLLHRIAVVKLELPPLRRRTSELPTLVNTLLRRHASTLRRNVRSVTPDAMALLAAYSWPGNVRELSNAIEQAVVLATRDAITGDDLPREVREGSAAAARPSLAPREDGELPHDLEDATLAFQKRHVARVLASCGGHRARAARLLGVSPATFFRHLRKLELHGPLPHEQPHA